MRGMILAAVMALGLAAHAAPGTYVITPTSFSDDGTGGIADGFRLYEGCDVATQALGALVADNIVVGVGYSLAGDDAVPPRVCVVGYNAAGEGGYAKDELLTVLFVPGAATFEADCVFETSPGVPITGALCVRTPSP